MRVGLAAESQDTQGVIGVRCGVGHCEGDRESCLPSEDTEVGSGDRRRGGGLWLSGSARASSRITACRCGRVDLYDETPATFHWPVLRRVLREHAGFGHRVAGVAARYDRSMQRRRNSRKETPKRARRSADNFDARQFDDPEWAWVGERRMFVVGHTPGGAPFGCFEDELEDLG